MTGRWLPKTRLPKTQFPKTGGGASEWGILTIFSLAALGWWLIFRSWLMQGDDFISATIGGARGGHFTFGDWARDSWRDYWQATGRQAGSLFRIFLRGGPETIRWVMPAQQVVLAAALLLWARTCWPRSASGRRPALVDWALAAVAVSAVPILAWHTPALGGAALVWAQASFDYVVSPALCLLLVGFLVRGCWLGSQWGWPTTGALGLLAALAPLLHEAGSLATLAGIGALLVADRLDRRGLRSTRPPMPARVRLVVGIAVISSLVQATSPGMWKRLGAVTEAQPVETGLRLMILRAANTSFRAGETIAPAIVAASSVLVIATLVSTRSVTTSSARHSLHRWSRWALAATHLVAMIVMAIAHDRWSQWPGLLSYAQPMNQQQFRWALVAVTGLVIAGGSAVAAAALLVANLGPAPLVALMAGAGSFVPPLLGGITAQRAMLPLGLWLVAVGLAITGAWAHVGTSTRAAPGQRRLAAAVMMTVLLVACWAVPAWWWRTYTGMRENAATYAPVLAQIEQARAGQRSEVVFPARYRHPELMYYYAFRLDRYAPMIRAYYDLPDNVRLVTAPR